MLIMLYYDYGTGIASYYLRHATADALRMLCGCYAVA